jgi:hypothetical protein
MSFNVIPMEVVKTVDPVLNLNQKRMYNAFDGGQDITYTQFDAQSNNNSNITITCNPPSENTVISPIIWHRYNIHYTASATATAAGQYQVNFGLYDAPRAFPIASITSTNQMKLNGTAFITNLNQYFHATTRYSQWYEEQEHLYSMTPSMLDMSLYYNDLIEGNRNPIGNYNSNSVQVPRGAYVEITNVINPASTGTGPFVFSSAASWDLTVTEPIFLSPFFFSHSGFAGIKTMTYNNIMSDLTRSWSRRSNDPAHGQGGPSMVGNLDLTSFTANVIDNNVNGAKGCSVFFRYITPKLLDRVPKQLVYGYNELLVTVQTLSSPLAPGLGFTMNMNALNLEAIPKRLYVYARENDNDLQGYTNLWKTDTYARIDKLNINWANKAGVLSSAQMTDLYQICRRNGCNLSFSQWRNYVGAVMAIDLGKDIGLSSLESPGLLSNPQLSMKVDIVNQTTAPVKAGDPVRSGRPITYSLYVIVVYEGTVSIINGNVIKQVACLNSTDIVNSQSTDGQEYVAQSPHNYFGGSVIDILKLIRAGVQHAAPVVKGIADVAEKVGLGIGGKIGGKKKGGKMINRSALMHD